MKRRDVGVALIERVDYPNKGRFTVPETGQRGTVKNTIPGQKVKFRVYKKHGERIEGTNLEIVERSPLETEEAPCSVSGACGGCTYQTLPYGTELELKSDAIKRLVDEVADEDTIYDGIFGSPLEYGYRNKLDLSFGDEVPGGILTLGMHRAGTRYSVLDACGCSIAHKDMRLVAGEVISFCREKGLSHYNKRDHAGFLRFLLIRRSESTGELLVGIATTSQMKYDFAPLAERIKALPLEGSIAGIHHIICDRVADALLPDRVDTICGKDHFTERLLGLSFKVTLFSFFQTNTRGAEVLYDRVRTYVREACAGREEKPVIYDLYCGTGTIAQIMAQEAKRVYGIELVPEAASAASENAKLNGLDNCAFVAGDVLEKLDEIEERPEFLVLDPPREGINPGALRKIMDYETGYMVYVSCKASSFVRDMRELKERGWRINRYATIDLFPKTHHCEACALLVKASQSEA